MNEPTPRFWQIFFEVFEAVPRQGPGNRACAARAFELCRDLPSSPRVLDLGCGVGGQTLHLAELGCGSIAALDNHTPFIHRLSQTIAERHLSHRIHPVVADIAQLPFARGSFDLIWSEGALYNIGIEEALRLCRPLLASGGYLAFTDAVWRKADPPPEVKAAFDADYPTMGWTRDILGIIARSGFETLGHFALPDEAWWDDFYSPMQRRFEELRGKYADEGESLAVLDELEREPELHRMHSAYYAYEFFVARRESSRTAGSAR